LEAGIIDNRIIGAVFIVIIVCAVAVYLGTQYAPPGEKGEEEEEEAGKLTVEMPLARVTAAVASREGVSQDNVEVYFCVPSEQVENENFAVGVVVNDQKSIVFIYDNSTNTIVTPVENEYTASGDALQGMSIIDQKDVTSPFAQNYLGQFNVNKIVPVNIVKVGSTYTFDYYDGYAAYPVDLWGFGAAVIDASGNVPAENMTHTWI
jgi:hypothetical protein